MTTATTTPRPALDVLPLARPGDAGVPLTRLTRVELRKLVDTRSGAWLLAGIALVTVIAVAVYLFAADAADLTFAHAVNMTVGPQAVLLPVLGIMAVTSEWTQRTGLVTHTLEPRRGRVLLAKIYATLILGLVATVVALIAAAAVNLIGGAMLDGDGSWAYGGSGLRDTLLVQLLSLAQGIAFGMLFMNTASAIVVFFALPTAFTLLFTQVDVLNRAAGWIDLSTSQSPLMEHGVSGTEWLQMLSTTIWWILLPAGAGLWRLLRREIK